MKSVKLIVLTIGIFVLFVSLTPQVFAGGGPAATDPCCLTINPGGGALALKGTLALVYYPGDSVNPPYVDVTLRLERSGNQAFFRLNLPGLSLIGVPDNQVLCTIFNPYETGDTDRQALLNEFVTQILETFFTGRTPDNTRLVITPSSASDYQGSEYCDPADGNCNIGDTGRISTLGDITVFAIDSSNFKPANPSCQ